MRRALGWHVSDVRRGPLRRESRARRRVPVRRLRQTRPRRLDRLVFRPGAAAPDGLHAGCFAHGRGQCGGSGAHRGACWASNRPVAVVSAAKEVVWVCLASHRLRYTTFFRGDGRYSVGFFNLWLARARVRVLVHVLARARVRVLVHVLARAL